MRCFFALAAFLTAGCSAGDDAPVPTWHQDIRPLLTGRCLHCHNDAGVAPFSLTSYSRARELAGAIANSVESGRMPPWGAGPDSMPLADDPSLTPAQVNTVRRWADHGAPEGDPQTPGIPLDPIGSRLSRVDLTLQMSEPFIPQKAPDDYRCFLLQWPHEDTRFVTGFNAVPGDLEMVHHVAVYLMPPDTPLGEDLRTTVEGWDEADDGPGYECFGGPSGGQEDLAVPIQQLAQWVPGMEGIDFPPGTGIQVTPGSFLVLQVHYNTARTGPRPDRTSVQFSLSHQVEHRAAFAPWLGLDWVLGSMRIPAGEKDVVYVAEDDPRPFWEMFVSGLDLEGDLLIHSALFHMHKLGRYGGLERVQANGLRQSILDLVRYDFDWQQIYRLKDPVIFAPGDQLSLLCSWDNGPEDQAAGRPMADVNWGEGSFDEMCVANLYISER